MIQGVLNIYKEKGYTSHDVVAKLRGITRQKKIGHTGTLDPEAEGVLPVCFGRATKLCGMLTDEDKTYEAMLLLGIVTDTQDRTGQVLYTGDTSALDKETISECIHGYIGEYEQLPPMYSALKVNGKKLYELAREGITVERKKRTVQIHRLRILEMELPRVRIEVVCSRGTYIRTLCHDIGQDLGCGGCMESLLRTRVGKFDLKDSIKLDQAARLSEEGRLEDFVIPVDKMFEACRAVHILPGWEAPVRNGNPFPKSAAAEPGPYEEKETVRVYVQETGFIGLFRYEEKQERFLVEKMF